MRNKSISRTCALLALVLCIVAIFDLPRAVADDADTAAPRRVKVLFLGDNGHHQPLERCRQVYSILGQRGIDITYTDQLTDLNPTTLGGYDVLLLYANVTRIAPEQEKSLLEFVESGHGFAVIHCGSYCFLNSPKVTAVIGARFKSHHTGIFKETIAQPDHPIEKGLKPIESFDETYVHEMHNEKARTVLGFRVEGDVKEPYTWVRTQGIGRVFYTAWGHDEKTWGNENFQALLERGVRWSAGDWAMHPLPAPPFTYGEAAIAIYIPGKGSQGAPKGQMQGPVSPQESTKHLVVPPGFDVKLVCSDPQIKKPICMAFDERGRLWVAETVDYPNNIQAAGEGHDQITICESSKNDGVMDKFTVFADHLSIPTSMCFANGGVIVQQAPDTLFLKDSTGSGHADVRKVLFHGWNTHDTHAGPSNLHWGFDNWIYGAVGYSGFKGEVNGQPMSFGMGCYRFKADGSKLEFLGSTTNNTWGFGLTEDNQIFGSTANNNPSWYLPIANRYYEQVKGMTSGRLEMICDTPHFWPITEHVRQVDCFAAYTAGTGHEIYSARSFPQWYWNRVAFVAEPTGHLLGQFELEPDGAGFKTRNHFNLAASDDEWTAPIAAMVGPDGAVWMIDWYNFIVQHNPTPRGLITGKGGAYESPLRDKRHGRVYRIIWKDGKPSQSYDLSKATPAELVNVLKSDNLLWRMHAQRLLVEKQDKAVIPALIAFAGDPSVDAIGLNTAAIHALWTLHGLGAFDEGNAGAIAVATKGLKHSSPAVRKAALEVLPRTDSALAAMLDGKLLSDRDLQVRKAAFLALSEMPQSERAGEVMFHSSRDKRNQDDRWLTDAASVAACRHDAGYLKALFAAHPGTNATAHVAVEVAKPVNLIPNPSFEDLDGASMPKMWKVRHYAGAATHGIDQPGFSGAHCLKIESTEGSDTSLFVDVPVEPLTTYTLSAWIKTKDVKGAFGALLNVHITDHKTAAVTGISDWKHVSLTFNTGQLSKLSINCLFGGWGRSTGTAWYDDVELVKQPGSGLPGTEGRVTGIVISQYARRGPADTVVATLSAMKKADPVLAVEVVGGLAADWPDRAAPNLSDADVTELRAVMESLPAAAKDRLLALAGRWGKHDLFPEQSEAVTGALRADVANGALDGQKRGDAARRLVAALDNSATVELLLKQIAPNTVPDAQLAILDALGDSRSETVGTSLVAQWGQLTPGAQKAALNLMLRKTAWTGALLDGIQSGKVHAKDVLPQQWQVLTSNPDGQLAGRARNLQKSVGGAPSADRAAIVKKFIHLADEAGDAAKGKFVFEKNCMVCHTLGDKGGKVGPELTGVGAKPKSDILLQILDPNRAVEGNYRQWIVKTKNDVISGRINAESRTNVEIMDATGQLHHILREDILVLKPTEKGIMPEGLEALPEQDIKDLLEFLSQSKAKR